MRIAKRIEWVIPSYLEEDRNSLQKYHGHLTHWFTIHQREPWADFQASPRFTGVKLVKAGEPPQGSPQNPISQTLTEAWNLWRPFLHSASWTPAFMPQEEIINPQRVFGKTSRSFLKLVSDIVTRFIKLLLGVYLVHYFFQGCIFQTFFSTIVCHANNSLLLGRIYI